MKLEIETSTRLEKEIPSYFIRRVIPLVWDHMVIGITFLFLVSPFGIGKNF